MLMTKKTLRAGSVLNKGLQCSRSSLAGKNKLQEQYTRVVIGGKALILRHASRYSVAVAVNPVTGRENPSNSTATQTPHASFFMSYQQRIPANCTVSMVALVGQPSGWPVSVEAGILTPVSVTAPFERENSGGDSEIYSTEAALWLLPSPRHTCNIPGCFWLYPAPMRRTNHTANPLLPPASAKPAPHWSGVSFSPSLAACQYRGRTMNNAFMAGADLFQAADFCTAQVRELMDCHDTARRRVTRRWLVSGLDALKVACDADLPRYLIADLTADELPDYRLDDYWPDDGQTLDYCEALARVLLSDTLPPDAVQPLTGLLHDLVNMLADQVKAPRFTHDKNPLRPETVRDYAGAAPHKTGAGIGVPDMLSAIPDAPASFLSSASTHPQIMVGWAGASKDAPVSDNAGYANPAQSATIEIGVSGGGLHNLLSEAVTMTTTPTPSHPQKVILPHVRRLSEEELSHLDPFLQMLHRERREMLCRFKAALDTAGVEYREENQ